MARYLCELEASNRAMVRLEITTTEPLSDDAVKAVLAVVQKAQFDLAAAAGIKPMLTKLEGFGPFQWET
jgi:hypothetical protein